MFILAIETSCDDTSVSIVKDGKDILSNLISSQDQIHFSYGGIVPEMASRKHLEIILPLIEESLQEAQVTLEQIDAIAVTTHPGLIGSLYIGVNTAKTLAYHLQLPLIPVNHLHAHFYSVPLDSDIQYPFIGLLVSGGHTLLAKCDSPTNLTVIGSTLDDACGECFDKIAKHFNLGYPGGPIIDKLAKSGNEDFFQYPVVKVKSPKDSHYYFSYSGLKTAVIYQSKKHLHPSQRKNLHLYKENEPKNELNWDNIKLEDLAASFQKAALEALFQQTLAACRDFKLNQVAVCGGVSANQRLRQLFYEHKEIKAYFPDLKLCTDNAAMIGGLAYQIFLEQPANSKKTYLNQELFKIQVSAKSLRISKKNNFKYP